MKSFYSKRVLKILLFDKQRGRCNACSKPFGIHKLELDHVIPRAGGGADIPSNFQLLCKPCNIRKHAHIPEGAQYGLFDSPKETKTRIRLTGSTSGGRPIGRAMTEAEKKAAQRARARALGLCSICRRNKPEPGYATCPECIETAKLRVKRNRAKAKRKRKKH